jgi:hypothetical protein
LAAGGWPASPRTGAHGAGAALERTSTATITRINNVGKLLRRTVEGDELVAEWSQSDRDSVAAAQEALREWLARDYEAVGSADGVHYEPLAGEELPVDAEQVILSTGMGGG